MQCINRWHCNDLFRAERKSNFPSSAVSFSNCSVLLGDQLASPTPFASENVSSTNSGCAGSLIVSRFTVPPGCTSAAVRAHHRRHVRTHARATASKPVISVISSLHAPHPLCPQSNLGTHSAPPASPETSRTAICSRTILITSCRCRGGSRSSRPILGHIYHLSRLQPVRGPDL